MRPPLTSPLDGGAAWRELRSEHFVLQTDSDSERGRELLGELERSLALLQQVAFDYQPRLRLKVRVVTLPRRSISRRPRGTRRLADALG
ncbi:MAG TPA: hypothetical protein VER96_30460 [Polyangiaceae bacterium]|nr:hypothetical protein [Polyangiaceae bacterium]